MNTEFDHLIEGYAERIENPVYFPLDADYLFSKE